MGLRVIMGFGAIFAAATPVVLLMAAVGVGDFSVAGRELPSHQWLRVAGPTFALAGVLFAAASYGISRGRGWARVPLMALWPMLAGMAFLGYSRGTLWPRAVAQTVAEAVFFFIVCYWYLYRKPNVRAYFDELRMM